MTAPLLGVCIPTYKRPDQLRRCLTSIIRSAGDRVVPIVVADDSTDDTNLAVMREIGARYPHLVHRRNPANLGIDRNILNCVDLCEARHAWIMGEDDRMTPEAIPTVLQVLARGPRPFVYVNYTSVDEDLALVLGERSLALDADVEETADEFLASRAWSMGFIGACVVDKALWAGVRSDAYVGTFYAHVGTIMEYLRGRSAYLIAKPLVLNRCGSARVFTWTGSTFGVLGGWARMVDRLRALYPGAVCDRAAASFLRAHGVGTVRFFCYLRADGALDARIHREFVRQADFPRLNRAAAWWIARAPQGLFRALRGVLWWSRRRRNRRISGY